MAGLGDDITLSLDAPDPGFTPKYPENKGGDSASKLEQKIADATERQARALERMAQITNPNFFYGQGGFFTRSAGVEVGVQGQARDPRTGRFMGAGSRPDVTGPQDPTAEDQWRDIQIPMEPTQDSRTGRWRGYGGGFVSNQEAARMRDQFRDFQWDREHGAPRSVVEENERREREVQKLIQDLPDRGSREFEDVERIRRVWSLTGDDDRPRRRRSGDAPGIEELEDLADSEDRGGARTTTSRGRRSGGPSASGAGGGGARGTSPLTTGGSAGGGGLAAGIVGGGVPGAAASVLGGGVGGVLAGLGVAALGYEIAPHIQGAFAARGQFRQEYVESQALMARSRALRGQGLPFGTMSGQDAIDWQTYRPQGGGPSYNFLGEPGRGQAYSAGEAIASYVDPLWQWLGPKPYQFGEKQKREVDEQAAAAKGMSYEDFVQQREMDSLSKRLGGQRPPMMPMGTDPRDFPDPEDVGGGIPRIPSAPDDRLYNRDPTGPEAFEKEDMRYGGVMAPLVATLWQSYGRAGRKLGEPKKYPDAVYDFHRPPTEAERTHTDADDRDKRLYNTPRHTDRGYYLQREYAKAERSVELYNGEETHRMWEQKMLSPGPDREIYGDAIVQGPVFNIVASPYGGMSA